MEKTQIKTNKPQKRTKELIHLLEDKDAKTQTIDNPNSEQPEISSLNTAEDLIDERTKETNKSKNLNAITINRKNSNNTSNKFSSLTQSIELFHTLIEKELVTAAEYLNIDQVELQAWIDLQIEVPAKKILALLRTMQRLHLDPLCEEIRFTQHEDGVWQFFITIESCAKLLNQHSQFEGLSFTQSETMIDGIPEWIECAIYRKDRTLPTIAREYFVEVRNDKEIWRKMPRRMLRHRALQQCMRLAL